jgi:4-diphosphocytidyl-2-C-methyl-D-erythritol kinase
MLDSDLLGVGGLCAKMVGQPVTAAPLFSPAKLNLFLAITGRRTDGFHELLSVAVPLAWGDTLTAQPAENFTLRCDTPGVPWDETNLVLRAARAFAAAVPGTRGAAFTLEKRIPLGAGLGGGSSNAVAALRALNALAPAPLDDAALARLAAGIGSDCALFLPGGPVTMRGRGERISVLPNAAAARLRGRAVLVFKPGFAISTPWAYARLAAESGYLPAAQAEARLAAWLEGDGPAEELLYNGMERAAFAKFPALPLLLGRLQARFGLTGRMSGSGSACFALLPERDPPAFDALAAEIRAAWGPGALVVQTGLW